MSAFVGKLRNFVPSKKFFFSLMLGAFVSLAYVNFFSARRSILDIETHKQFFGQIARQFLSQLKLETTLPDSVVDTGNKSTPPAQENKTIIGPFEKKLQAVVGNGTHGSLLIGEKIDPSVGRKCLREMALKGFNDITGALDDDFEFLKTEEGRQYKKILGWHYAYGPPSYGFGFGHQPFKDACCEEPRCFFTGERGDGPNPKIPLTEFDAVVFHFRGLKKTQLPKQRSEHQRWVFFEGESPAYSFEDPAIFNGLFNWTMTYRTDSDIYYPYGYIYPNSLIFGENDPLSRVPPRQVNRKSGGQNGVTTSWLVSHCSTLSYREKYVSTLNKYIPVDIYGNCGNLKCKAKGYENDGCYSMLERKYKFYLSFENSFCKEYITEKFFNILKYQIVPVVYGYGDYAALAPPNSYIDTKDFKSVKALADYLLYLHRNDTAYNEYFRWKENYTMIKGRGAQFCRLCKRLHTDQEKKVYTNLAKWFLSDAHCSRLRPISLMESILHMRLER